MRSRIERSGTWAVGLSAVAFGVLAALGQVAAAEPAAAPDIGSSTPIPSLPFSESTSTSGTSAQQADPLPSCTPFGANHAVWYQLTAPADGTLVADTIGSDYDTVLAVYVPVGDDLEAVACNDSAGIGPSGSLGASRTEFPVRAGATYYLQISAAGQRGVVGAGGRLSLHVAAQ